MWNPSYYSFVKECVISEGNGELTFTKTDAELYVPVVTLSIQDINSR